MENMTVKDVRSALRKTRTVLVPLGVCEQHGYHLPLSTDIHNALQISIRVSEKTGALVAPPLNYAFSGGELPGTINVSPTVTGLVVTDICRSLALQGFLNIALVLGHGGTENINALKDSLSLLLRGNREMKKLNIALAPVWEYSADWKKAFGERDFHAGHVETSLMLYWAPELVRRETRVDRKDLVKHMMKNQDNYLEVSKNVDAEEVIPFVRQRPDIKVGIMGDPSRANGELGEKICGQVVEGICRLIRLMEKSGTAV